MLLKLTKKELSNKERGEVGKALEVRLGHGNFTVEYDVDPEIKGGLQIYFGNSFLDCSLGTRISKIREEISRITL